MTAATRRIRSEPCFLINTQSSVQIGFQSCETLESLRKLQHLRRKGAKNDKDSGYEDETAAEEDSDQLNEEERLFGRLQVTHCSGGGGTTDT